MDTMDVLTTTTATAEVSFLAAQQLPATQPSYPDNTLSEQSSNHWSLSSSDYDWQRSTEENYRSSAGDASDGFVGEFREFRRRLDRSYHNEYLPERQFFQDSILRSMLQPPAEPEEIQETNVRVPLSTGESCRQEASEQQLVGTERNCLSNSETPPQQIYNVHHTQSTDDDGQPNTSPWIVFTAGVYGAGKSYTVQKLQALGCFPPRSSFVGVDPDAIRRRLPEFARYPSGVAGVLTQKEAGMIAELLTDVALSSGRNVVVDGSLRDAAWHEGYFTSLRARFGSSNGETASTPRLRIGILYVTAPSEEIYRRVRERGTATGRSVPPEFLERSMREVPGAIQRLKPRADFFLHVHNAQQNQEDHREDPGDEKKTEWEPALGNEMSSSSRTVGDMIVDVPIRRQEQFPNNDIEAMIFQQECRSIVGY